MYYYFTWIKFDCFHFRQNGFRFFFAFQQVLSIKSTAPIRHQYFSFQLNLFYILQRRKEDLDLQRLFALKYCTTANCICQTIVTEWQLALTVQLWHKSIYMASLDFLITFRSVCCKAVYANKTNKSFHWLALRRSNGHLSNYRKQFKRTFAISVERKKTNKSANIGSTANMSVNMKLVDGGTTIKKEPISDSQFAEADSSTNSTAHSNSTAETTTRQSSLQRIQMRKEKVSI